MSTAFSSTCVAKSGRHGCAEARFQAPHLKTTLHHTVFNGNFGRKLLEERLDVTINEVVDLVDCQTIPASRDILYRLLQGCIEKKSLALGRKVHQLIKRSGFNFDTFLGSHIIRMFGECGSLTEASQVFKELPDTTVYTWSALILAHAKLDQGEDALKLFANMQLCTGIHPNAYTLVAVVKACASILTLLTGRLVHTFAVECCLDSDLHLCNTLVDMYSKCNSLNNARVIFDRLVQRSLVTWNAMISGYAQHGLGDEAFNVLKLMLQEREIPDRVTFMSALKACATTEESYPHCSLVHALVVETGYDKDDYVQSCLIDLYAKCGDLAGAWSVFDLVQCNHSVVTWNAMIAGCANEGCVDEGLHLFGLMQEADLLPDTVALITLLKACAGQHVVNNGRILHAFIAESFQEVKAQLGNTLLDMYAKCGSVFDASKIFQTLPKDDVVTWTAMIGAHVSCEDGNKALQLFHCMQEEGVDPNEVTYANALKACSLIASAEDGKLTHADAISASLESDDLLGGALLAMYSKCGSIKDASKVFNNLANRNVVTWSSMFAGFAMNGHYELAWKCFQDMQLDGIRPDNVTMLSLLAACSQLGSTEEGCKHFESTFQGHFSAPWLEHYTCLLELLAQAGCPTEARSLLGTMPSPSDSVSRMSFLHNCQTYGNTKLGYRCFDQVVSL